VKRRVAVLISGRGSNMAALVAAATAPAYPASVEVVISNRPEAPGLEYAAAAGVPTEVIDHRRFPDRERHEAAIHATLHARGIELVCLAGYMRVLTPFLVERWNSRMMNIHPSLLPAFPGLDTHARALAAGAKLHGCTVHLVTSEVDNGPILAQAAVPVLPGDSEGTLAARVLRQEHRVYVEALRRFALGDRGFGSWAASDAALVNPLPLPDTLP
jgi:phosphoribosylglycinamide formyltransferase 1